MVALSALAAALDAHDDVFRAYRYSRTEPGGWLLVTWPAAAGVASLEERRSADGKRDPLMVPFGSVRPTILGLATP